MRSWQQFHLSTAVVVMLMAGLLLWLNFKPAGSWDWAIVTAKQVKPLPEIEFVDFRLGGTYAVHYGWPWTAWRRLWQIAPMLPVQPAQIPDEWRRQASEQGTMELNFELPSDLFDRVLPGVRPRFIHPGSMEGFMVVDTVDWDGEQPTWKAAGVAANALVALVILVAVGASSEWLIRRRK